MTYRHPDAIKIIPCHQCGQKFHALPPLETPSDSTCLHCLRRLEGVTTDGPDDRIYEAHP